MDFFTVTFLLRVIIYLFFTKPKVFLSKVKSNASTLRYLNFLDYTFLIDNKSEFDKEDFDLLIDFNEDIDYEILDKISKLLPQVKVRTLIEEIITEISPITNLL